MKIIHQKKMFISTFLLLICWALTSCSSEEVKDVNVVYVGDTTHFVSNEKALEVASMMFPETRSCDFELSTIDTKSTRSQGETNSIAYVINVPDNGGYVVVGADNRMKPILAFSETGAFRYEETPDDPLYFNFVLRLGKYYSQCINDASKSDFTGYEVIPYDEVETRTPIITPSYQTITQRHGPYLSNSWSQAASAGYSDYIVLDHPGHGVGCVALATGQLMVHCKNSLYYHGINYNFTSLRQKLRSTASQTDHAVAVDSIARMLYDVSEDVHTHYGSYYPGLASDYYSKYVLNNLGYYTPQNSYANSYNKNDMVYYLANQHLLYIHSDYTQEPNEAHPTTRHAYLCDGYAHSKYGYYMILNGPFYVISETDYLHFDFGWGGTANGYFETDVFEADEWWCYNIKYYAVERDI